MRARPSSLSLLAVLLFATSARAQTALQTYSVDPSTVTIAGISSGGFMAVQMHVAYSSAIHGAAIFAGGPYYCAQASESTAVGACESGSGLTLSTFESYTASEANAGAIDSPSNLSGQPVYLFSGTGDTTVHQATMNVLQQYYENYSSVVTYNNNTAAEHGWISLDGPNACASSQSPYINNCNIDPEQTFLTMFYGTLTAKNTGTLGGGFVQFDQTPFCAGGSCSAISMDTSGWLFVPTSCASGQACKLVVVLHGCLQSQSVVQEDLVKESGVDEWADTNGIVVLYPQAIAESTPSNLEGCWDWWGYTGANYAVQSGPQMQTVMAMINQITGVAVVATDGGMGGGSSSSGGSSGSCLSLSQACAAGQTCCAPYSCELGYCLLNLTGSSSGSSSSSGSGSSVSGGSSSGSTNIGSSSTSSAAGSSGQSGSSSGSGSQSGSGSSSGSASGGSSSSSSGSSVGSSAEKGSGGCASTGGPASLLALLAAAGIFRRRRA
jgi:uncharacterized protein (TIGR03382 family)